MENEEVKEENTKFTCCFCNKEFSGGGNNPWPVKDANQGCCSDCNKEIVIPARISKIENKSSE